MLDVMIAGCVSSNKTNSICRLPFPIGRKQCWFSTWCGETYSVNYHHMGFCQKPNPICMVNTLRSYKIQGVETV